MIHEKAKEYPLNSNLLKKALFWACQNHPFVAYFNPNAIPYPHSGFHHRLFAGKKIVDWTKLSAISGSKAGIFSYDLKNKFERLHSHNPTLVQCPEALFFLPELTITFSENKLTIVHPQADEIFNTIQLLNYRETPANIQPIKAHTSKDDYIQNVKRIQNHIREGDIYEMNYCIAFSAHFAHLDPIHLYWRLKEKSPMPFSCFFKANDQYLIGASPERFLKKEDNKLIAQPIKGTIKRGSSDEDDRQLQEQLKNSEKEKAENLMIVDLMRNDLARVSVPGSVKVDELFGIYPFRQVSQMISTVSATLDKKTSLDQIIPHTFPMGSMTGAPKIKCMELIERYENFKRGWFSGAVGYVDESDNFDFSVIIRSIIVDQNTGRLYFAAGSAITYDADPEYEYKECLLKAQAIFDVLQKR